MAIRAPWSVVVVVVLAAMPAATAQAPKGKAPQKGKGPPPAAKLSAKDNRLVKIRNDLEAQFRYMDDDRDGFLDEAELARGFRDKNARPYHEEKAAKPKAPAEPGKDGSLSAPAPKPKPGKKELKSYPDYQFLITWDKDRDDKVSKQEFDGFIDEVISFMTKRFEKEDEIEKLQKELLIKDINASRKARIRAALDEHSAALDMLNQGFHHNLHLDTMYRRAGLRWDWYRSTGR